MDDGDHVADGDDVEDGDHAPPRPVDRFRQTAAGTVVAAGLLGLRDALEGRPEREEIAIVSEAPGRLALDDDNLVVDGSRGRLRVVLPPPPDDDRALDDAPGEDGA